MAHAVTVQRPRVVSTLISLVAVAILVWLGLWQLQRLKWKENLLVHIAALRTAAPRPVEDVLGGTDIDFVRVRLDCPNLMSRPRLKLYGVQDGGIGYRLMTACPVSAGEASSVLVDLGFVAGAEAPAACDALKTASPLTGPLTGVLRKPDARTFVTPPNQPAQNLWYSRDLPAMARAIGAGPPAPAFVALESAPGAADGACPLAKATLPGELPNNHLSYAITWFGLAAALAGVYLASLLRRRPS